MRTGLYTVFIVLALSFCFEKQAQAYVDPGSGILAFQTIGALFTGALFYFRRRIKTIFLRSPKQTESDLADVEKQG
jgi:hypothetical protein